MSLTTLKSIEAAIKLIEPKKENLKKAYEELQSHSSSLSCIDFTWPELESYFNSLQSDLMAKFSALQSIESSQAQKPKPEKKKVVSVTDNVPARPELKALCEKMDGSGLRKYVADRPKERAAIRAELADAYKHAPDPGLMLLDAVKGFFGTGSDLGGSRRVCVVLMEELLSADVEIGPEARERAKAVAEEWKAKIDKAGNGGEEDDGKEDGAGLERLGYLQLLAAYKLVSDDGGYDVDELVHYAVSIARYRQAVEVCRALELGDRISDVIQKLIGKGKQLLALKFIFEFELTDEFPPVPLLKAHVTESKKQAQKIRKDGKNSRQSLNEAATKEINALKSVIKCIDDHELGSQYPKDVLLARMEKLEKEKADRKRNATAPLAAPKQAKQQKQNGNKRVKASASGPSAARKKPQANLYSKAQAVHAAQYAGSYALIGPHVAAAPYVGSSSGLYASSGAPMGFSGSLNPAAANPYPPELHGQPSIYDRPTIYGGYDVPPQYHPAYYPQ